MSARERKSRLQTYLMRAILIQELWGAIMSLLKDLEEPLACLEGSATELREEFERLLPEWARPAADELRAVS